MYEIADKTADAVVDVLVERADRARRQAAHRDLRGHENRQARAALRAAAEDAERAIAGLNTGEGVTRRSARV